MVLRDVASRSSSGRVPTLLGLVAVVALVAAYLSDCLPGLGAGGSLGAPQAEAPADAKATPPPEAKAAKAGTAARLQLVVKGEQCTQGDAAPTSCPELCAALRTRDPRPTVEIDATAGMHGVVEDLRRCLKQAGFTDVRTNHR